MEINFKAGKSAELAMLVNVPKLVTAYYIEISDPSVSSQRVMMNEYGFTVENNYKHAPQKEIKNI
jgi:hypothetical protein